MQNWVPLLGKFETKNKKVVFFGETTVFQDKDGNDQPGLTGGNILIDELFNDGSITAEIEFEKVEERTSGQIIFNSNSQTRDFISAGINSGSSMFAVMGFINGKFEYFAQSGDKKNLKEGVKYSLKVQVKGSEISLWVNGVEVINCVLPFPLKQSQPGLFLFSGSKVNITDYKIFSEKSKVFVIMKFCEKNDQFYEEIIKKVCEDELQLNVVKADEIFGPGLIIADILKYINESKILIAEISEINANVFFELGYAYGLKKPVILLGEENTKLPFDISPFRVLFYQNTIAGKEKVYQGLMKHLKSII